VDGIKGVERSQDKNVNEQLWGEPVERDAVILELVALGLDDVLFVGDGVEESSKLRPTTLEDVDLTNKHCGVLVDVLWTLVGHYWIRRKSDGRLSLSNLYGRPQNETPVESN
jgi:hypothetical protein